MQWRSCFALVLVFALVTGVGALSPAPAHANDRSEFDDPDPPAPPTASEKLDVMYVGAHPDDEAGQLATLGQWDEFADLRTGVISITRGEGGGNAVGTEEGAELGLLREAELRNATSWAGISNIYSFDYVDFWYNLSAPLTEEVWARDGELDLLERAVRVLRMTRPEVVITMNPGINHGHHQYAAWHAIEAFQAAADPEMFPEQLSEEGLEPHRAAKLLTTRTTISDAATGPECVSDFTKDEPTDTVYGTWLGTHSELHDETWAQVRAWAIRQYVSQGWGTRPDPDADPDNLGCSYYTLIDSRVPFTPDSTEPDALLEGAHIPAEGGLPLGTEFYLTTDQFTTAPGAPVEVTAHATHTGDGSLGDATVAIDVPSGWEVTGDGHLGELTSGTVRTTTFTLTPPDGADAGRIAVGGELSTDDATGRTQRAIELTADVTGKVAPHPDVARFREFVSEAGTEQVDSLIKPVHAVGVGGSREVVVEVSNNSEETQDGEVTLDMPTGFEVDEASRSYAGLAPNASTEVAFTVENTDDSLPDANDGGEYDYTVTTSSSTGDDFTEVAGLVLVPVTQIPQVDAAPDLDGVFDDAAYPGEALDLDRLWEGSETDASGDAWVSWHDDALYVFVDVEDGTLGAVLEPDDAKRHWRTDAVEVTIDPRGDSRDPSTTYKMGVFPITDDPDAGDPPVGYRDADNHQGPAAETSPGFEVASQIDPDDYDGYTLEMRIPFSDLPAAVDPEQMGLNVLIYDSDNTERIGDGRYGWSTFGGVQAQPWRWGQAMLEDYDPPADLPPDPIDAIIPDDVTESVKSPQSIIQSTEDGVPLASSPPAPASTELRLEKGPNPRGRTLTATLAADEPGTAHVFAWADASTIFSETVELAPGEPVDVSWEMTGEERAALITDGQLLVGYEHADGGTAALAADITPAPFEGVHRFWGGGRIETAIALSEHQFDDGEADTVVLARADEYADALSGTPVAVEAGGPLLITSSDELVGIVADEIRRVLPEGGEVIVLGGEEAIEATVASDLADLGYETTRLAGPSRIETSLAVAEWLGDREQVLVTTGYDYPDALSAGTAAVDSGVVLLTLPDEPHPAIDAYLEANADAEPFAIGGPAVRAYPDAEPVHGATREGTAVAVAERFFDDSAVIGLARRDDYPDALAGGAHVGRYGGPLLITYTDELAEEFGDYLVAHDEIVVGVAAYGGTAALSDELLDEIRELLDLP